MNKQIKFDIVDIIENDLKVVVTCSKCLNECKVYSVVDNAIIYCNKFKKFYKK